MDSSFAFALSLGIGLLFGALSYMIARRGYIILAVLLAFAMVGVGFWIFFAGFPYAGTPPSVLTGFGVILGVAKNRKATSPD
ncbi:MAG: hypothetical protein FWD55_07090 [Propionibacteriaceae bacterium]|nr:hypothetical protein [Propionibacteriaceae bacterium]